MVVHGFDEDNQPALDEISIIGRTRVAILEEGKINVFDLYPEDFGLEPVDKRLIMARDTLEENLQIAGDVLDGKDNTPGEKARMNICLANASAILFLAGKAGDLKEGMIMAREMVMNGRARAKLQEFIQVSNSS